MPDWSASLSYDSVTGDLTWLPGTRHAGKIAGHHNKTLGYIVIGLGGEQEYAHRVAWFLHHGYWPKYIDHIDGNRTNNALVNLRDVSKKENHKNTKKAINSTSGITGVSLMRSGKWRAYLTVAGKQIHLGSFDTQNQAAEARKSADTCHGFHVNHGR